MVIPKAFNSNHVLDPGTYDATFADLRRSILVHGCGSANWDSNWRLYLVGQLEMLTMELWKVGITEVFADGSFVEEKDHPSDIDGYFEIDITTWPNSLMALNASKSIWVWNHHMFPKKKTPMLTMKFLYNIELYPHAGQFSGISGPNGYPQMFPQAFRRSRQGKEKGIIRLIP